MSRLFWLAAAILAGLGTAHAEGFLVFDETVVNYATDAQGKLAIPRLLGAVTTSGFIAVLENSSGTRLTGSFTWIAQGY